MICSADMAYYLESRANPDRRLIEVKHKAQGARLRAEEMTTYSSSFKFGLWVPQRLESIMRAPYRWQDKRNVAPQAQAEHARGGHRSCSVQ